jgi:PTH1 family peptidyl-tRNA hydrolase
MALRRGSSARRGTPADLLVIGLANPGSEYQGTRHNVGGDAVELVAARHGGVLKVEPRQRARLCEVSIGTTRVALAVPTTFMNESGVAVPPLLSRTGIDDVGDIVVVHDELDLEPGRLQLKAGGGIAGHNGLRSIAATLSSQGFVRVRIGIGRPPSRGAGASFVLSKPRGDDATNVAIAIERAADAIEAIATSGIDAAMGTYNVRG